ncbi:MAG: hemerythrin domain-containing protein [Candidatus Dactylopiibacterium sp.]|nr:hemerythrin domain-containing protein [Candidatus Dactylopiibacterium sp.]
MRKLSLRLKHLAQEHQAVMHFATAVRSAHAEDDRDLPEVVERVRKVFQTDLEPHFAEEERYALPMLREAGRDDLADEVLAQHEAMRALERSLDTPSTETLVAIVQMLERHVEFEDGEVWDVLETALEAQERAHLTLA